MFERKNNYHPQQKQHPHQKPKELIKALIEATTNEKDLVFSGQITSISFLFPKSWQKEK